MYIFCHHSIVVVVTGVLSPRIDSKLEKVFGRPKNDTGARFRIRDEKTSLPGDGKTQLGKGVPLDQTFGGWRLLQLASCCLSFYYGSTLPTCQPILETTFWKCQTFDTIHPKSPRKIQSSKQQFGVGYPSRATFRLIDSSRSSSVLMGRAERPRPNQCCRDQAEATGKSGSIGKRFYTMPMTDPLQTIRATIRFVI